MEGLFLLTGHLVGDYVFQNDWMAGKKSGPNGNLACTAHCAAYTVAVALFSFWFLPWWAYLVVFAVHWPIDRWRLARRWMVAVGQKSFATGALAPWSVIVVDNTFHVLTLALIGLAAK